MFSTLNDWLESPDDGLIYWNKNMISKIAFKLNYVEIAF